MEFLNHTLSNGLQIVAECNPEAHSMAMAFCVNTGSRDESDDVAGVSHFLEHMVFKGTQTRTADEVNSRFDELGAEYNAWTGKENTTYYAVALPEHQDEIVHLWSDLMRPALREDDFDMEKQVIIEEIHMYEDQPPFGADEKCELAYYGGHRLSNRVLGTVESVTNLDVDAMRNYFRARYSPTNMLLAAAGRIDFEALVAQAEACCGSWQRFSAGREVLRVQPQRGDQVIHRPSTSQQYVIQLCSAPAAEDSTRFAAHLLVSLLGDSSGSRLYWELLHPGLAEQVSTHYYEYDGAGLMMTWLCCDPNNTERNIQAIFDIYRQANEVGFTEKELARAKTKFKSRLVLAGERPQNRMINVGMNWMRRSEYRSIKQDMDVYDSVTLDDVAEVMRQHPLNQNNSIAVGPLSELNWPTRA